MSPVHVDIKRGAFGRSRISLLANSRGLVGLRNTRLEMVKLIKYLRLLVAFSVLNSFCAANQVYKWKTIAFKDLTRDVDTIVDGENVYYNEENVILTGFDYDVETGYICAAFPRIKPSVPVTIGCFSADEYDKNETPKFTAFPTVADNDLPVG